MNCGIAVMLGLLGSLHCAAMCGPLMLALPWPPGGPGRFVAGRVTYQLGRLTTYCLLGLVAGLAGRSIFLAGLERSVSIALGVALLAGFLVSGKISVSAPVVRWVSHLKGAMAAQLGRRGLTSLAVLGILNGLLPCGLVYVAMAGALSSGGLIPGLEFMAAFGLGTLPMMLGIGIFGRLLPLTVRLKLRRAIPLGVCLLAGLLILRGLALGIPYLSPNLATGASCCAR
jgi:hypothetical protein